MKWILGIITLLIIIAGIFVAVYPAKAPTSEHVDSNLPPTSQKDDLIRVTSPYAGAEVTSPLTVVGEARGSWYFEASFPYELKDAKGKVIAHGPVHAQSDWMTTDYVPFMVTISYPPQSANATGTLVLKNDNPSGDPARDKSIEIPVVFK